MDHVRKFDDFSLVGGQYGAICGSVDSAEINNFLAKDQST